MMDELTVDEFLDIVQELRQQVQELKKRVARIERESDWYDEEDRDDEDTL
jgi:ubiquinone biosynthesis protein UbiJ